ncbi:MAG TPA: relaxase/mobilization nuclease domain-containing protein [Puia sp.]|jgi:hypothetical protein
MHASIIHSQNTTRVLQYHQQKVGAGKGEFIAAGNFVKDLENLSLPEMQYHFDRLTSRNEKMWKPVFHTFLRFDQHEDITNEKMALVAQDYLEGMHFGDQPWLVCRHYDSLIPHAHLVSTNVREDGTKLKLHLRDLYYSRELTHSLEDKYGLHQTGPTLDTGDMDRLQYGEKPLYSSMTRILDTVIPSYAYTSLDEFNAVLSCYDMQVTRGRETSDSYKHGGLSYLPVKEGFPDTDKAVQAHTLKNRPTLHNLETHFAANEAAREPARMHLATAIDWCLAGAPISLGAFKEAMQYEGISVVCKHSGSGGLENCWFVDHNAHAVFEGAALGENYSAQNLAARCMPEEQYRQQQSAQLHETTRQHLHL